MQFFTTLSGLVALSSGVTALSVTSPSENSYWVQFSTNTIAWALSSGDPTSVTIQVINPTNKGFNGPFSIAEFVPAGKMSYDVTNVQLTVGDGYQVRFVSPLNNTQVLATSSPFSVKVSGTPEAKVTFAPGTQNPTSDSTSNSTTSSSNSTNSRPDMNGSSFKKNGTANANAKSSSVRAIAAPSMTAFAIASLLALVA